MNTAGFAEIALTIALAIAAAWPLGDYIAEVWAGQPTPLDPVLRPLEQLFYRAAGIDPDKSQRWWDYALCLIGLNTAGFVALYGLLRLQGLLPLNPTGAPGMTPDQAFNTAISFVTNTDWQTFAGETAVSHLTQMAGFTVQDFMSAGAGMAVAAALTRAFKNNRSPLIGNFWRDLVRVILYFLLPTSIVTGLVLVALGVPQTLAAQVNVHTLEGARQVIAIGPIASQEAINQLGTNGAGFFFANAAHPFINPNGVSNLIEAVSMNVGGLACVFAFGRTLRMGRDARALIAAMTIVVGATAMLMYFAETHPTPALIEARVQATPNMEGKEVRFGAPSSMAFAAMTTGSSTGATSASMESFTPTASGLAMFLMQVGEMMPGGAGAGLLSIVMMALMTVLVAGLMVGRTPEYLGKKIEAREIKLVFLSILILSAAILCFSAAAAVTPAALSSVSTVGPHGLMEILYAYSSGASNNGSSFQALKSNTPYWNTTLAVAMMIGRYGYFVPVLAVAGSLAAKQKLQPTAGTFPTDGAPFVILLLSVTLIIAGLQFFPSLALGPIAEQIEMQTLVARQTGSTGYRSAPAATAARR